MQLKKKYYPLIAVIAYFAFAGFTIYAYSVKDTHCLTTQISSKLFDFNSFSVEVYDGLKIEDFVVVQRNSGNTIFSNGRSRKGILNEYGDCIFELYYKDSLIYVISQYRHNNWHTNDFTLKIHLKDGAIDPTLFIKGHDTWIRFNKRYVRDEDGKLKKVVFMKADKTINKEKIVEE